MIPVVKVDEVPTGTHVSLPMHQDVAPFDNPDVRAGAQIRDRPRSDGEARAQWSRLHRQRSASQPDHALLRSKSLAQRSYDPDKARFHLKKAGMENLKLDLSAADVVITGGVDMALLYQRDSTFKAGLDINVIREPNDSYW